MANVIDVTEGTFESEVLNSETPVMVDFWAPWCGPCKMLTPTVHAIAEELDGKLKVVKCNTDDAGAVASRYQVFSIPTLLVFKGGKVVDQIQGAGHPKQRLVQRLESHL
jgi:thioredoxin 1